MSELDCDKESDAGKLSLFKTVGAILGLMCVLEWLLISALSETSDWVENQARVQRGEGQLGRLEEASVCDHCEAEAGGWRRRRQDQEREHQVVF